MNGWHKAGNAPTFALVLDWRVAIFALLLIAHFRVWTAILFAIIAIALSVLARFGYTLPKFYARLRSRLAGPVRVSRPWWWRRRFNLL